MGFLNLWKLINHTVKYSSKRVSLQSLAGPKKIRPVWSPHRWALVDTDYTWLLPQAVKVMNGSKSGASLGLWGLGVLLRTFLVWGGSGQTRKSEKSKSSC